MSPRARAHEPRTERGPTPDNLLVNGQSLTLAESGFIVRVIVMRFFALSLDSRDSRDSRMAPGSSKSVCARVVLAEGKRVSNRLNG